MQDRDRQCTCPFLGLIVLKMTLQSVNRHILKARSDDSSSMIAVLAGYNGRVDEDPSSNWNRESPSCADSFQTFFGSSGAESSFWKQETMQGEKPGTKETDVRFWFIFYIVFYDVVVLRDDDGKLYSRYFIPLVFLDANHLPNFVQSFQRDFNNIQV